MFGRKKNRTVSLEMKDHYIRGLIYNNDDVATGIIHEYPLESGLVVDEVIQDEVAFFDVLKSLVKEWGISRCDIRFFAPDHGSMMRSFDHPNELNSDELKAFVEMELGRSIHLPFENPLLDVYDHVKDDGEAVIYASASEEPMKLVGLYQDAHLHPTVLDIRTLSNIRFFDSISYFNPSDTYLIADWAINAVTISIYSNGNVEFLRFQSSDTPTRNWVYTVDPNDRYVFTHNGNMTEYHSSLNDQVFEIGQILNFYTYSLHKGEKSVDHIIMLGDNPEMAYIAEQMSSSVEIPVEVIDDAFMEKNYPQFETKHSALIGLSLKEEST